MQLQDVQNLAELAKLELTTTEKEKILSDMEGILAYVKQIDMIETPEVEVEYDHRNVWREDVSVESNTPHFSLDLLVGQFPDVKDRFVKVKKIL